MGARKSLIFLGLVCFWRVMRHRRRNCIDRRRHFELFQRAGLQPQRISLNLLRTMRTRYKIDSYQQTYFVIDSFQELFDKTAPDFTPIYERVKQLPELVADAVA